MSASYCGRDVRQEASYVRPISMNDTLAADSRVIYKSYNILDGRCGFALSYSGGTAAQGTAASSAHTTFQLDSCSGHAEYQITDVADNLYLPTRNDVLQTPR